MFDSVLGRGDRPRTQFGKAAVISAAIHAAIPVGLIWLAATHHPEPPKERDIHFVQPVEARAGRETVTAKREDVQRPPHHRQRKSIVQPTRPDAAPPAAPVEPSPQAANNTDLDRTDTGDADAVETSDPPLTGAQLSGPADSGPQVFVAGQMTAPRLIDGAPIAYPPPALQAHVEGTMVVQCVITTAGHVEQCRTIKPLPYMEDTVLKALTSRRYTPVLVDGTPVAVKYVFQIRMVLPR